MDITELNPDCLSRLDRLQPIRGQRIFDLVEQAGVDMTFWLVSARTQKDIDPSNNIYQSTQWGFGGGKDPIVACLWWKELECLGDNIVRRGCSKADTMAWSKLRNDILAKGETENRLTTKIKKAHPS